MYEIYAASDPLDGPLVVPHFDDRSEAVHVDVAIVAQFLCKLRSQSGMEVRGKVAEGILKGKLGERENESVCSQLAV